uniref:Uncharacterized protein n=1 Tax=Rhizophora mucronata TaxID=61149 RepID=A0A2P2QXS8_RHIMU
MIEKKCCSLATFIRSVIHCHSCIWKMVTFYNPLPTFL